MAAIILAAGESRRMGSPKALLPIAGTTFLRHLIGVFEASRARPIRVVLGHHAERIRDAVAMGEATVVVNTDYRRGMLSSIRVGLSTLEEESIDAALVCPVDHPRLEAAVVDRLIACFEQTRPPVVVPVYNGRRGHPVLFSRSAFGELMKAPDNVGARQVVWDHAHELVEVEMDYEGVLVDVDTPEDYRALMKRQ